MQRRPLASCRDMSARGITRFTDRSGLSPYYILYLMLLNYENAGHAALKSPSAALDNECEKPCGNRVYASDCRRVGFRRRELPARYALGVWRGAGGLRTGRQTARRAVMFIPLLIPPRMGSLNIMHLLSCDAGGCAFPYADVLVVDVGADVVG